MWIAAFGSSLSGAGLGTWDGSCHVSVQLLSSAAILNELSGRIVMLRAFYILAVENLPTNAQGWFFFFCSRSVDVDIIYVAALLEVHQHQLSCFHSCLLWDFLNSQLLFFYGWTICSFKFSLLPSICWHMQVIIEFTTKNTEGKMSGKCILNHEKGGIMFISASRLDRFLSASWLVELIPFETDSNIWLPFER